MDGLPTNRTMRIKRAGEDNYVMESSRCPAGQIAHQRRFAWLPTRLDCGGWTWLRPFTAMLVFDDVPMPSGEYECVYVASRPGFENELTAANRARTVDFGRDPVEIERNP